MWFHDEIGKESGGCDENGGGDLLFEVSMMMDAIGRFCRLMSITT